MSAFVRHAFFPKNHPYIRQHQLCHEQQRKNNSYITCICFRTHSPSRSSVIEVRFQTPFNLLYIFFPASRSCLHVCAFSVQSFPANKSLWFIFLKFLPQAVYLEQLKSLITKQPQVCSEKDRCEPSTSRIFESVFGLKRRPSRLTEQPQRAILVWKRKIWRFQWFWKRKTRRFQWYNLFADWEGLWFRFCLFLSKNGLNKFFMLFHLSIACRRVIFKATFFTEQRLFPPILRT